jgi:hypothetical protein
MSYQCRKSEEPMDPGTLVQEVEDMRRKDAVPADEEEPEEEEEEPSEG